MRRSKALKRDRNLGRTVLRLLSFSGSNTPSYATTLCASVSLLCQYFFYYRPSTVIGYNVCRSDTIYMHPISYSRGNSPICPSHFPPLYSFLICSSTPMHATVLPSHESEAMLFHQTMQDLFADLCSKNEEQKLTCIGTTL